MADVDPKVAQRVFKDYQRGHHVPDIIQRYGLTTKGFNQVVKFESAVHSRVQTELAKQEQWQAKAVTKQVGKPVAKVAKGR